MHISHFSGMEILGLDGKKSLGDGNDFILCVRMLTDGFMYIAKLIELCN